MKSWHDSGIPLAIVLEAIDFAFDARQRSGRKRVISSLSYCRHSVEELWEERSQQLVGAEGSVPELDPPAGVRELATALTRLADTASASIGVVLADTARQLGTLAARARAAPKTEEELIRIENEMMDGLLAAIPDELRARMYAKIDTELARYPMPSEETRVRTREANLRRLLRKELKLPRLSLFG